MLARGTSLSERMMMMMMIIIHKKAEVRMKGRKLAVFFVKARE